MKLSFTGRKIELTQALKDVTEKKFKRLDRYFKEDVEAKITLSADKNHQGIEATIYSTDGTIYRVSEKSNDMYVSIDRAIDAFERQFRKHKTRLEKRMKSGAFDAPIDFSTNEEIEEEKEFNIVKKKSFSVKPMSVEEAILQMNLLGHNFFIFTNAETDKPEVVYKRKDQNYGLIEIK